MLTNQSRCWSAVLQARSSRRHLQGSFTLGSNLGAAMMAISAIIAIIGLWIAWRPHVAPGRRVNWLPALAAGPNFVATLPCHA